MPTAVSTPHLTPHGPLRVYLDVRWDDLGRVVEIDGGHHVMALMPVDDALRQNDVVLTGEMVLRIPILGLCLQTGLFMDQVERGLHLLAATGRAKACRVTRRDVIHKECGYVGRAMHIGVDIHPDPTGYPQSCTQLGRTTPV